MPPEVTCQSFLDYLRDVLVQHGEPLKGPAPGEDPSDFYRRVLPEKGFDYFALWLHKHVLKLPAC